MENIEVTAHFDSEGYITPLKFIRDGRTFRVEGTGRRWEANNGLNILVMVAGNQIVHLVFDFRACLWKLVPSSENPTRANI